MTTATVVLFVWYLITFGVSQLLYTLANNASILSGVLNVIITVIAILSYIISTIIFLIYWWSYNKDKQLRAWGRKKKKEICKTYSEKKEKISQKIKDISPIEDISK